MLSISGYRVNHSGWLQLAHDVVSDMLAPRDRPYHSLMSVSFGILSWTARSSRENTASMYWKASIGIDLSDTQQSTDNAEDDG